MDAFFATLNQILDNLYAFIKKIFGIVDDTIKDQQK